MSGWASIYRNMMSALHSQTQTIARMQEQVSSGSRINRPSDDPGDAWRVLTLEDQYRSLLSFGKNLQTVSTNLDQVSSVMQETADQLVRAKQLLTEAATATNATTGRTPIAEEIDSILEQLVSMANTKSSVGYLFGGGVNTAPPYSVTRIDGQITQVSYQGGSQATPVPVAEGVNDYSSLVGPEVFQSNARQAPVFFGNTGAKNGSGTSSVTGDVWLSVAHGTTTYAGVTGVAAGASSSSNDTIVGTGHYLTIDADNKTIQLDDGSIVSYASGGADVALQNGAGDKVFVNLSGIDAGLAGTTKVDITATAKLSIDDSASTVEVTGFPANVAVTDSRSGKTLYVDASSLARTGLEPIRVGGTYDLFQSLIDARDLLNNTRGLSEQAQSDLLDKAVDTMGEVTDTITEQTARVGSRQQAMDSLKTTLENNEDSVSQQSTTIEQADVAELAAGLARTQTLYEMVLDSSAKILNMSLLDFIK